VIYAFSQSKQNKHRHYFPKISLTNSSFTLHTMPVGSILPQKL